MYSKILQEDLGFYKSTEVVHSFYWEIWEAKKHQTNGKIKSYKTNYAMFMVCVCVYTSACVVALPWKRMRAGSEEAGE